MKRSSSLVQPRTEIAKKIEIGTQSVLVECEIYNLPKRDDMVSEVVEGKSSLFNWIIYQVKDVAVDVKDE